MGGAMQPQGHVQVLVNMIDFGMDLQEAGDAPRVRHDGSTRADRRDAIATAAPCISSPASTRRRVEGLRARGHRIEPEARGVRRLSGDPARSGSGAYFGASESRKDGHAAGY